MFDLKGEGLKEALLSCIPTLTNILGMSPFAVIGALTVPSNSFGFFGKGIFPSIFRVLNKFEKSPFFGDHKSV